MAVRNKGFIERMERMGLGISELHGRACLSLRGTSCGLLYAAAEGAYLRMAPSVLCCAVDPHMGLTVMARLLHEVATAANLWSWQQAVFTGELGDWLGVWHSTEIGWH